jgi:hypothetical protein
MPHAIIVIQLHSFLYFLGFIPQVVSVVKAVRALNAAAFSIIYLCYLYIRSDYSSSFLVVNVALLLFVNALL